LVAGLALLAVALAVRRCRDHRHGGTGDRCACEGENAQQVAASDCRFDAIVHAAARVAGRRPHVRHAGAGPHRVSLCPSPRTRLAAVASFELKLRQRRRASTDALRGITTKSKQPAGSACRSLPCDGGFCMLRWVSSCRLRVIAQTYGPLRQTGTRWIADP